MEDLVHLLLRRSSLAASASVSLCSSRMTDWLRVATSSSWCRVRVTGAQYCRSYQPVVRRVVARLHVRPVAPLLEARLGHLGARAPPIQATFRGPCFAFLLWLSCSMRQSISMTSLSTRWSWVRIFPWISWLSEILCWNSLADMVWYGAVLYGAVRYGMVRCGTV